MKPMKSPKTGDWGQSPIAETKLFRLAIRQAVLTPILCTCVLIA